MKYRNLWGPLLAGVVVAMLVLVPIAIYHTQIPVINITMSRYNTSRTGTNLQETTLNTTNVNPLQFGKLFSRSVIGDIYAQPLYLSAVDIPGKDTHNVVYVATMHNDVYAFDADDPAQSASLWQVNLGQSFLTDDLNDIWNGELGILSTPCIDLVTNTIYVVNVVAQSGNTGMDYWIHALDIATGQEKFNGPTLISGSVTGTGAGSVNGQVSFNADIHFQRPGLALVNGKVYVMFGSINDQGPYHGWVFGYTAADLTRSPLVWNDTPNGDGGGIWQAGVAPVIDAAGDLYFGSGNGSFNGSEVGTEYGISYVRLHPSDSGISVVDYFTPFNADFLNDNDLDIADSGTVMIPGTSLLISGEKHGQLYVIDTNSMGHFNALDNHQIKQSFGAYNDWLTAPPVVWQGPKGMDIYLWSLTDHLKEYVFLNGQIQTNPIAKSHFTNDSVRSPELTLSAEGSKAGTGVLWAVQSSSGREGVLRAIDATDINHELWNSDMNDDQDRLGNLAKFNSPIVANGKVYAPTFSNQLVVYGLLPIAKPSIPVSTALPTGTGSGLLAQYFSDPTLSTLALTRVDSTVNFEWGSGSPDSTLPVDHFSARWLGQVEALSTGYYTFSATADDGVRLWVNNIPMFDHWYPEGTTRYSGTLFLKAGQKYDIKMEYYEDGGGASTSLWWSGPGVPNMIIPQNQLYPIAQSSETAMTTTGTPSFDTAAIEKSISGADASRGSALFTQYGCAGCHNIPNGTGPYIIGLGQQADTRRSGYTASAYIYESIVDPNAYIVPGYVANIMPSNFKTLIPERDLYDLVSWLVTQ